MTNRIQLAFGCSIQASAPAKVVSFSLSAFQPPVVLQPPVPLPCQTCSKPIDHMQHSHTHGFGLAFLSGGVLPFCCEGWRTKDPVQV